MTVSVAIAADPPSDPALCNRAKEIAGLCGLRLDIDGDDDPDVALSVTPAGLQARVHHGDDVLTAGKPFRLDLASLDVTSGPGRSLRSPLAKAVGIRKGDPYRPTVLDCTAGFGEDAWLLAAAGCRITAIERHPAMFALLHDALDRVSATHPDIARGVDLHFGDALGWLQQPDRPARSCDVLYLDPMFPARRKAAQRKPMRLARLLAGDEGGNGSTLLRAALALPAKRVAVKRPRHAPRLVDTPRPIAQHLGKALRFDVYSTQTAT